MTTFQKCNYCIHEKVCSKRIQYESACNRISSAVDYSEKDLLIVNVRCAHYVPYQEVEKGGIE